MNFPKEMEELRVLQFVLIRTSLPSSLQFMNSLQTLSLDHCRLNGDFAGIGSLKMLRVLSFFKSIVRMFPTEIVELTNLQRLDLRFHYKHPTNLPVRILSSLKELEELYLGVIISEDIESLKEVCTLSKLRTIQFEVKDDVCFHVLLENLELSKLIKFDIAHSRYRGFTYEIKRNSLQLKEGHAHTDIDLLKALMGRVEWFYLNGKGLTNVVNVLGEDGGFQNLKDLELYNCDMKYLVDATSHPTKGIFLKLEMLLIDSASQLEELIHGDDPVGTLRELQEVNQGNLNARGPFQCPLGNLRTLKIFRCAKIKSLFSKSMVNSLGKLETIDIRECPVFERIVRIPKDEEGDCSEVSEFPKLKELQLYEVPEFRSRRPESGVISGFDKVMLPKLELLRIKSCDGITEEGGEAEHQEVCFYLDSFLPKVRYLEIEECPNMLTIAKCGLVHGFQDLEKLIVERCLSLEFILDFEEMTGLISQEPEKTTLLDRLEQLKLNSLPKLEHIWRMIPPKGAHVFRNLKQIHVRGCNSIRYLLTPTITNMLVHLEKIMLEENELMEGIIGNDTEKELLESLVLPKLKYLDVKMVPSFRKPCCCSPGLTLELPSVSELNISLMVQDILTNDQISRLTTLEIGRIGDQRYLLIPSSAEVLVHLEKLVVYSNKSMEAIFGTGSLDGEEIQGKTILLPKLRKLTILDLPNFIEICCSLIVNIDLPSLTRLSIEECPKMSKLWAGKQVNEFQDFEKLSVSQCSSLEVVFDFEGIGVETEEAILFSRPEYLYLNYLPKLKHIWRMHPPNRTPMFRDLKRISVSGCSSLRYLLTPSITNMLVHLEEIRLKDNELMEVIIGRGEIDMSNDGEEILLERLLLPKLKSLEIRSLPSFRKLWCCSPELTLELPSLSKLDVRYLLTPSAAGALVHLDELELHSNESIEAIFGTESLDEEEIPNKTIVLPNLRKLSIKRSATFKMLCCSSNHDVDLPSLTSLYIKRCPKMSKLCAGRLTAPQLKNVNYGYRDKETEVDVGTFINSWLKDCESKIRCLECTYYKYQSCGHLDNQNSELEMEGKIGTEIVAGNTSNGEGCSNDTTNQTI